MGARGVADKSFMLNKCFQREIFTIRCGECHLIKTYYLLRYDDSILVGSCFRNVSPATVVKGPLTPFCAATVPTARFTARAAMQKHSGPKDMDSEAGLAFSCARTSKLKGWSDKP